MKIFTFFLQVVFTLTLNAQVNFEALHISTSYPEASQKISFTFNQNLSSLKNEKNIYVEIYEFNGDTRIAKEPKLLKKGNLFSSSFLIDSSTHVICFYIFSDNKTDNNFGDGYFVPIYKERKLINSYFKTKASIYSFYGEQLFGLEKSYQKSFDLLEEGLKKFPQLQNDADFYITYMDAVSKTQGSNMEAFKTNEIEKRSNLPEGFYNILEEYYLKLNNKAKSDSLLAVEKLRFPKGDWTLRGLYLAFIKEKSVDKKAGLYDALIGKQLPNERNLQFQASVRKAISDSYKKEGNEEMAAKWSEGLPLSLKMSDLNNKSWAMALEGKDLQTAKQMSAEATSYAKEQFENPTEKKYSDVTNRAWKQELGNNYAMYADTYAYILYKLGEYTEGLPYAKAAATFTKFQNAEYNDRYAVFLQKIGTIANSKKVLEEMTGLGSTTETTKNILKELYIKEKKTENGFDAYIVALEGKVKKEKKLGIANSMINKPAPKFALKDWEGKEVTLESLKGKIIVVDFWATWCGPCIASMPGMEKAKKRLATRDDVIFLFIDTKEHVDNKIENAKEFMKKKNYSFYVLMDNDNKMSNDFDVNGIPAKFIIDKNGNIRFASIGYGGNTDELAEEVLQMVEIAGK